MLRFICRFKSIEKCIQVMLVIVKIGGPNLSWIIIYTKPRQEVRAKEHLENLGLDVSLPLRPIEKIKDGAISITSEPLFPRYIFIRNDLSVMQKVSHMLRNVRGVSQIVKFGGKFAELDAITFAQISNTQPHCLLIRLKYTSRETMSFLPTAPLEKFRLYMKRRMEISALYYCSIFLVSRSGFLCPFVLSSVVRGSHYFCFSFSYLWFEWLVTAAIEPWMAN